MSLSTTKECPLRALVYMLHQDDPFRCTAAKLAKFKLAEPIRSIPKDSIVLNPFSEIPITKKDIEIANSVCAIDCSWEHGEKVLKNQRLIAQGIGRRLPALLAGNPTSYAKLGKLSSAEALAGAFYILGEKALAGKIMDKFKWGHTYLELNAYLLEDYARAKHIDQIPQVEQEYFPNLNTNSQQ
jgi:pre-rRNA-processing protein TSR3